jgi:predicted phosphodiesterase
MIRQDFVKALDPEGAKIHICLGDLFDKPKVSFETIWFAAHAYLEAAANNPDTEYFILAGNHDLSRDHTHVSAWDIFCSMMGSQQNITTVETIVGFGGVLFVPWNPAFNAAEMIGDAPGSDIVVGHWDLDGQSPNLIPIEQLKAIGAKRVYNGHVHLPREEVRDGIHVVNVGSLQPFAHGEGDEMYVTLTLDELKKTDVTQKCVRVRLDENQTLDFEVDCLQLQVEHADRSVDLTVDYDSTFDMKELIARAGEAVPKDIWNKVMERL